MRFASVKLFSHSALDARLSARSPPSSSRSAGENHGVGAGSSGIATSSAPPAASASAVRSPSSAASAGSIRRTAVRYAGWSQSGLRSSAAVASGDAAKWSERSEGRFSRQRTSSTLAILLPSRRSDSSEASEERFWSLEISLFASVSFLSCSSFSRPSIWVMWLDERSSSVRLGNKARPSILRMPMSGICSL